MRSLWEAYLRVRMRNNPTSTPKKEILPEKLLTKRELAKRLRVSERKIELDSQIPKIQWGRSLRYDWQEVLVYLKS